MSLHGIPSFIKFLNYHLQTFFKKQKLPVDSVLMAVCLFALLSEALDQQPFLSSVDVDLVAARLNVILLDPIIKVSLFC
jgi:hypothetical protein